MREGWKYKKLKDVASLITDGDWIESRHQSESGIRLIQTGNVGNGIFKAKDDKPHYISEDTFLELGCTEIFRGDCLVSRLPEPVGRACIIPEVGCRMITAVDCTIIRFKDCVLPKLFVYYTRSKQYKREIDNSTTGTTRKRISRKNLESVSIPLLPVDEQNKIVAELDLLTEIIDKQKQQLKELDTLAQSIFYDMFGNPVENDKGWEKKQIGKICTSKKQIQRASKRFKDSDIIRYIDISSIDNINNVMTSTTSYGFGDAPSRAQQVVEIGDVLISLVRPNLNNVAMVSEDGTDLVASSGFCVLRANCEIVKEFLFYSVKMKCFTDYLMQRVSGANYPAVREDDIMGYNIILPPLELQESFAQKIQSIESQKQSINRSLAESQKLFDYTMDKYFG